MKPSSKTFSSLRYGLGKLLLPVIGPSFLHSPLHLVYDLDAVTHVVFFYFFKAFIFPSPMS